MAIRETATFLAVIALKAEAATAQAANGRFQIGACTTHWEETVVRLEDNVLTFHESVCTLSNTVLVQGTDDHSHIGYFAGERETWTANMFLIPFQDGAVMRFIRDGIVLDHARCKP